MNNMEQQSHNYNKHRDYVFNIMEEVVIDSVKAMLAVCADVCKCDTCMYNISAIVLNSVPPHYVTTKTGEMYSRAEQLDSASKTQISVEVARAIEKVRSRPLH